MQHNIHLISHLGLREHRGLWAKRNNSQMGAGLFVVCFGFFGGGGWEVGSVSMCVSVFWFFFYFCFVCDFFLFCCPEPART